MKVFIIPTANIMTTAYYYFLLKKIFNAAGFEVMLDKDFKKYHPDKKNDIFVTGNPIPTMKLWLQGYRKVCTWYQGVGPEERQMQKSSALKVYIHTLTEKMSLRVSCFCFFVSDAIRKHFEKKYKIQKDDLHCAIIPCFNETNIYPNCFDKDVKKPFSFVYSGGLGVWQCFDETLDVFKLIKRRIPEATLDIFTYQIDEAEKAVLKNGISDVQVRYVPKEEMNKALSTKMFGFVLRENNVVNKVATPTKFSNYIANGVIPVFSNCINDFSAVTVNMNYVVPIGCTTIEEMADTIVQKTQAIVEKYNVKEHQSECIKLFDSYYSEKEYINTVSEKIRVVF